MGIRHSVRLCDSRGSLPDEKELRHAPVFERLFRMPAWHAFLDRNAPGQAFHWISGLKALEVGDLVPARGRHPAFLRIALEHVQTVREAGDIARLSSQRLTGTPRIAARP